MGHAHPRLQRLSGLLGRLRLMTILKVTLVIAVVLFGLSLGLSNRLARELVRSDYEEYNETIFGQAEAALERSVDDLSQLCYTFISNETVGEYLLATSFEARSQLIDAVKDEFDRLTLIQTDIKGILLYDLNGKLVASADLSDTPLPDPVQVDSITFGGRTEEGQGAFFSIHMPIYHRDTSRRFQKVGSCQMLVSLDFLRKSLEKILPDADYFCLVTDGQGRVLLQEGTIDALLLEDLLAAEDLSYEPEDQVLYQTKMDRTGWTIRFGVPTKLLFSSIDLLQRNYLITYLIMALLLAVLFTAMYVGVLRPIREQIGFMTRYARDRSSRMPVTSHNEMGELASHLNQMLDDIDRLTEENVRAQQRVLEAEYQKKQS